jgi:hypothetical protein
LALDIGGSSVKIALWDGRRLSRIDRIEFGSAAVNGELRKVFCNELCVYSVEISPEYGDG